MQLSLTSAERSTCGIATIWRFDWPLIPLGWRLHWERSLTDKPEPVTKSKSSSPDPFKMARSIETQGPAPVHLWDPPFCGDMDLVIRRDGTWVHEGKPIRRKAMRKLFASILKKEEDGEFYLVTPVEKVRIQVEDCPFIVTDMEVQGADAEQLISMTTDTDETFRIDGDHPIRVEGGEDGAEPHPVVHVRNGLYALISRNVFYRLVDMAEQSETPEGTLISVRSSGEVFVLGNC